MNRMLRVAWTRWGHEAVAPVLAVLAALAVGGVIVALVGSNPFEVYGRLLYAIFGSSYGFGQVLFKATTLMGTGLAVAVAFRAGLFNIGAEGQMFLGGLASGAFALLLPASWADGVGAIAVLAVGALAGAAWAAVPAILRAWVGVHEVINTIMLNFVAFALGTWILVEHLALFETVHTAEIPGAARILRLETIFSGFRGAPVNGMLIVSILLCLGCYLAL